MTLLEKIYDLASEQSQIVHAELVGDQLIEVCKFENYRWLQIGSDSIQGLMDTNSPSNIIIFFETKIVTEFRFWLWFSRKILYQKVARCDDNFT